MKRTILRSLVLTFAIIIAIAFANIAPDLIEEVAVPNSKLGISLAIGVLIVIILIVVLSNWTAQKIKLWKRNKKKRK